MPPNDFRRLIRAIGNGLPDYLMIGRSLTKARRSAGVGFNEIGIKSAIAKRSEFTPPIEEAVSASLVHPRPTARGRP